MFARTLVYGTIRFVGVTGEETCRIAFRILCSPLFFKYSRWRFSAPVINRCVAPADYTSFQSIKTDTTTHTFRPKKKRCSQLAREWAFCDFCL